MPNLPEDADFRHLRLPRGEAARFVRNVLATMRKAQRDFGEVRVRMGVTGTGVAPNYRFEDPDGKPLLAIDGANHDPWKEGAAFEGAATWSSSVTTFGELEELLRSLTGYSGPATKRV